MFFIVIVLFWCSRLLLLSRLSFFVFVLFLFLSIRVAVSLPMQRFCRARGESFIPFNIFYMSFSWLRLRRTYSCTVTYQILVLTSIFRCRRT